MLAKMFRGIGILILSLVTLSHCNEDVEELKSRFDTLLTAIKQKDLNATLTSESAGCRQRTTLSQSPTESPQTSIPLRFIKEKLFPDIHLSNLTENFLKLNKLKVVWYELNTCDVKNPTLQCRVAAETYEIADRNVILKHLRMTVTFSAFKSRVVGMASIVITDAHAQIIGHKDVNVRLFSQYDEDFVLVKWEAETLPLTNTLNYFNRKLNDVFLPQETRNLDLESLKFKNAKIEGYLIPQTGFEFQISAPSVSARGEQLTDASKTFLIVQNFRDEEENVNFLFFSILENQQLKSYAKHLDNFPASMPAFTPLEKRVYLAIARGKFGWFQNNEIKMAVGEALEGVSSRRSFDEGVNYLYKVDLLNARNDLKAGESKLPLKRMKVNSTYVFNPLLQNFWWNENDQNLNHLPGEMTPIDRKRRSIQEDQEEEDVEGSGEDNEVAEAENVAEVSLGNRLLVRMTTDKQLMSLEPLNKLTKEFKTVMSNVLGNNDGLEKIPINDREQVDLKFVQISPNGHTCVIRISVAMEMIVLPHAIEFKPLVIGFSKQLNTKESLWFIEVGESDQTDQFEPPISIDQSEKRYFLKGEADVYSHHDITENLTSTNVGFQELDDFPYINATFKVQLTKRKEQKHVLISATTALSFYKGVVMETAVWGENVSRVATMMQFERTSLDGFLFRLYKRRMLKECWMNFNRIEMLVNPSLENVTGYFRDDFEDIGGLQNKSTVSLRGRLSVDLKRNCMDSSLCNFLKSHLSQLEVHMKGSLSSEDYLIKGSINATITMGVWVLRALELTVKGADDRSSVVKVTGQILHKPAKHTGKVFIGEDEESGRPVLKASFDKPWTHYQGFSQVKIVSMVSNADISNSRAVDMIKFSGTIEIGDTSKPLIIKKATIEIGDSTGTDIVYALLRGVKMDELVGAFKGGRLNYLMRQTTITKDGMIALTTDKQGRTMESYGKFKFTPQCNAVLPLNTFIGDVTACLDLNEGATLRFTTQKLSFFDGKFVVQRSRLNDRQGPKFNIDLTTNSTNSSSMQGYLVTIGYQGNVDVSLQNGYFSHQFSAYLFDKVKMHVTISGIFGRDEMKYVAVLGEDVTVKRVATEIKSFLDIVNKDLERNVVEKYNHMVDEIEAKEKEMHYDLEREESANTERRNEVLRKRLLIEQANEDIKRDCVDKCGKKCLDMLEWSHNCSLVSGRSFSCFKWQPCRREAADTRCIAKCEGVKVASSVDAHQQRDDIRYLADDIIAAKQEISTKEQLVKEITEIRQQALSKLADFFQKIAFVTKRGAFKFSLTKDTPTSTQQIKDIRPPTLNFPIINYMLNGQTYVMLNRNFSIDQHFYQTFAHEAMLNADRRFSTLNDLKDAFRMETAHIKDAFEDFQRKVKNEEDKELEKIEKEESSNRAKRTINVYPDVLQAAMVPIDHYSTKGAKTSEAFEKNAAWVIANRKQSIEIPSIGLPDFLKHQHDTCSTKRDVVNHFEDLVISLKDLVDSYHKGKKYFESNRRDMTKNEQKKDNVLERVRPFEEEDMNYWSTKNIKGSKDYLRLAKRQLDRQNALSIKYWASQILPSSTRSSIPREGAGEYFARLKNAVEISLQKRAVVQTSNKLDAIIKEFVRISESNPTLTSLDLSKLTNDVTTFKRAYQLC